MGRGERGGSGPAILAQRSLRLSGKLRKLHPPGTGHEKRGDRTVHAGAEGTSPHLRRELLRRASRGPDQGIEDPLLQGKPGGREAEGLRWPVGDGNGEPLERRVELDPLPRRDGSEEPMVEEGLDHVRSLGGPEPTELEDEDPFEVGRGGGFASCPLPESEGYRPQVFHVLKTSRGVKTPPRAPALRSAPSASGPKLPLT